MKTKNQLLAVLLMFFTVHQLYSQNRNESDKVNQNISKDYNYFIRTSYYSFTNWLKVGKIPNIYFYELHLGKEIDEKSKMGLKLARVKLFQPLGIQPWEIDVNSTSDFFPGRIEEYGAGFFYQRMLWKGLYASVEVMPFLKVFLDQNDNKIDNGFRLYTSYHLGYRIPIAKSRFFVEPQIHCQYWPINSKGPDGFRQLVEKHDNYFLFEPNIYIGMKFN